MPSLKIAARWEERASVERYRVACYLFSGWRPTTEQEDNRWGHPLAATRASHTDHIRQMRPAARNHNHWVWLAVDWQWPHHYLGNICHKYFGTVSCCYCFAADTATNPSVLLVFCNLWQLTLFSLSRFLSFKFFTRFVKLLSLLTNIQLLLPYLFFLCSIIEEEGGELGAGAINDNNSFCY